MTPSSEEYRALRSTIAHRGTVRMVLLPSVAAVWAVLATVILVHSTLPFATLLPLAVLVAGFEAASALHLGVERIGRFLQVFHEETNAGQPAPRWETIAMLPAPPLGIDPLFSVVFSCLTIVNLSIAGVFQATAIELGALAAVHAVFLVRIVRVRARASTQRARDLAHYRAVRDTTDLKSG